MDISWTLVILAIIVWLVYKYLSLNYWQNLPPGPKGLPILGYLPFLKQPIFQTFTNLRKEYGDVVTVQMGSQRFIILNSYKSFKATMLDDANNFSGRIQSEFIIRVNRNCGIIFVDGPKWIEHRRFCLRVLRDFGLGKSLSEEVIHREAESLVDEINSEIGKPVNTLELFNRSVSNVICSIVFGERSGFEDPQFSDMLNKLNYITHDSSFLNVLPMLFPILSKFTPFTNFIFGKQKVVAYVESIHDYIQGKIDLIRSGFDEDQSPSNLTEAYLIEQAKQNRNNPDNNTYSDFQLMRTIFELFIAGTETTSTFLDWALLMLTLNPDVQTKVHREIDDTIGRDRLPTLHDKKELNYISAVLDEISRFSSLVPNAPPHRNFRSTQINGFTIPADSIIIPNIHAVHTDPEVWEHPESFHPEHFLDMNGKYSSRDELVIFGVGKRACMGESLARSEMFLFFVTLMQNYEVSLHDKNSLDMDTLLVGSDGAARSAADHKIVFKMRDSD